jgi:hypothetical protein
MAIPAIAQTDESQLHPEAPFELAVRPPLRSIPAIDTLTGGFEPGKVTLIDSSSRFVFQLASLLCVRAALDGPVVFVDGGNSIDPYGIARICRARRLDARLVLSRIRVARAFTAYQLSTLVNERLDWAVRESAAGTIVVACPLDLLFDKDVPWRESYQLTRRSLGEIKAIAREAGVVAIVTHYSPRPLSRRMAALLDSEADAVLTLRDAGDANRNGFPEGTAARNGLSGGTVARNGISGGAIVASSRYGSATFHIGSRRPQRTLDQFGGRCWLGTYPADL